MNPVAEEILARGADGASAAAGFLVVLLVVAIYGAIFFIYARIVKRAGYPWPWIFILLVPIVNIVMICIFALKEWPIERELARTRAALAVETGSPYPDPTIYGYGDYPINYADTALYAGAGQQPGGYPTQQVPPSPFGAQYPAPGTQYPAPGAQGYSTPAPPYGQPDAGWQGQNGGLYGGPTDEPRDPQNPWAPKG